MKRIVCLLICSLGISVNAWAAADFSQVCPALATPNLCGSVIYCTWLDQGSCLATDPEFARTCPMLATPNLCSNVIYCAWSNVGHCVAR